MKRKMIYGIALLLGMLASIEQISAAPKKNKNTSNLLTSSSSDSNPQDFSYARIGTWNSGSYGKKSRPPLETQINIAFDNKVTDKFTQSYFQFLSRLIKPLTYQLQNVSKYTPYGFNISIDSAITQQQMQQWIDEANDNFDPVKKKKREQDALNVKQNAIDAKLTPEELLHRGLVNDSADDIKKAVVLGANIDLGVGEQAPLLLATIMGSFKAVMELLSQGANPNIVYMQEPLIFYFIKMRKFNIANAFFSDKLILSQTDKDNIVDIITTGALSQDAIDFLKLVGYEIKVNFDSLDLSKNRWYKSLLQSDCAYLNLAEIELFLKNGANPNQTFELLENVTWTPLLLILNIFLKNFIKKNKGPRCDIIPSLDKLLLAGADINQIVQPLSQEQNESSLSFLLRQVAPDSLSIINFLINKGASLEIAINLFLKNGGSVNQSFTSPSTSILQLAVENNKPISVQLLVDAGAYKDQKLLKLAISKGYGEIIKILMV